MSDHTIHFHLEPADNERLANLCGPLDSHLRQIERRLGVDIANRGCEFTLKGPQSRLQATRHLLCRLFEQTNGQPITSEHIHLSLQDSALQQLSAPSSVHEPEPPGIHTRRGIIRARGTNQDAYLNRIRRHDVNFGIGPAGTGKTYLAVACAVEALEKERVRRIILARPAVEAGEKLGFLPGDLAQKVDPYLRPLYDALYEMLGFERAAKLQERNVIEVAPLAFMRGRTLNDSFIILDEAQNATVEQLKMFLTRVGFGSTAVVTGDITQIDLPRTRQSGLRQVIDVLREVEGISFTFFTAADVVRHPLVQRIVAAYEAYERQNPESSRGPD